MNGSTAADIAEERSISVVTTCNGNRQRKPLQQVLCIQCSAYDLGSKFFCLVFAISWVRFLRYFAIDGSESQIVAVEITR